LQALVLNQISNSGRAFCTGNSMEGLKFGAAGGLPVGIQNELPGEEKESNRQQASKGGFHVSLRTHTPRTWIFLQTWASPTLKRVNK
jgi:hypothetical protein